MSLNVPDIPRFRGSSISRLSYGDPLVGDRRLLAKQSLTSFSSNFPVSFRFSSEVSEILATKYLFTLSFSVGPNDTLIYVGLSWKVTSLADLFGDCSLNSS